MKVVIVRLHKDEITISCVGLATPRCHPAVASNCPTTINTRLPATHLYPAREVFSKSRRKQFWLSLSTHHLSQLLVSHPLHLASFLIYIVDFRVIFRSAPRASSCPLAITTSLLRRSNGTYWAGDLAGAQSPDQTFPNPQSLCSDLVGCPLALYPGSPKYLHLWWGWAETTPLKSPRYFVPALTLGGWLSALSQARHHRIILGVMS